MINGTIQLHEEVGGTFFVQDEYRYVPPERMMPTEEVLPGVLAPLFILPNVDSINWDNDHMRFEVHDPRLTGDDKRPLRYCAVQHLPRPVHDRKNMLYDAVEMPTDPDKIFQAVLLGAAGYVTHHALDISGNKPKIQLLDEVTRARIHQQNFIHMQPKTKWKVGLYLATHVLRNGLEAIRDSREVTDFLAAERDVDALEKASFRIMRLAVQGVVEPFEPTYANARQTGGIRKPESTATRFVTRYFDEHQPDYVPVITDQLL